MTSVVEERLKQCGINGYAQVSEMLDKGDDLARLAGKIQVPLSSMKTWYYNRKRNAEGIASAGHDMNKRKEESDSRLVLNYFRGRDGHASLHGCARATNVSIDRIVEICRNNHILTHGETAIRWRELSDQEIRAAFASSTNTKTVAAKLKITVSRVKLLIQEGGYLLPGSKGFRDRVCLSYTDPEVCTEEMRKAFLECDSYSAVKKRLKIGDSKLQYIRKKHGLNLATPNKHSSPKTGRPKNAY